MNKEKLKNSINKRLLEKQKRSIKKYKIVTLLSIIALIAINVTIISSLIVVSSAVKTTGRLVLSDNTIKVYTDESCIEELTYIEWGEMYYNRTIVKTAYVLNTNTYSLKLSTYTSNWQPNSTNVASIFDFNSSLENVTLQTSEGKTAEFRLTLVGLFNGTKEQSEFSFDILVNGEQVI